MKIFNADFWEEVAVKIKLFISSPSLFFTTIKFDSSENIQKICQEMEVVEDQFSDNDSHASVSFLAQEFNTLSTSQASDISYSTPTLTFIAQDRQSSPSPSDKKPFVISKEGLVLHKNF
jgi:hypothetical protein